MFFFFVWIFDALVVGLAFTLAKKDLALCHLTIKTLKRKVDVKGQKSVKTKKTKKKKWTSVKGNFLKQ